MRKFIDRDNELATLEKEYNSTGSSFVVLYGRRRVGKTALIMQFLKNHNNTFYFIATEEPELQNPNEFKIEVAKYCNNELLKTAKVNWNEIFAILSKRAETEKLIIVIDEFQYIGKSNNAFPSIIQKIWELSFDNMFDFHVNKVGKYWGSF